MLFGPDRVIACPSCGAPHRVFTLRSWNSLGFACWTDGFSFNSMAWRPPEVSRCEACSASYWLEDAPTLGLMPDEDGPYAGIDDEQPTPDPVSASWTNAPRVRKLGAAEYRAALSSDAESSPERLFRLRLLTFWRSNHRNRNPRRKKIRGKEPWETANLRELLALRVARFDKGADAADAIAIAEMYRELGDFSRCLEWTNRVEDVKGIAPFVTKIGELARGQDVAVAAVHAPFAPDDREEVLRMAPLFPVPSHPGPDEGPL